jgi:hypothetical protein
MEEGKIANGLGTVCAIERSPSMYIRMCYLSNTLLKGQVDQFHPLVNQPVVLLVQLNVRKWKKV